MFTAFQTIWSENSLQIIRFLEIQSFPSRFSILAGLVDLFLSLVRTLLPCPTSLVVPWVLVPTWTVWVRGTSKWWGSRLPRQPHNPHKSHEGSGYCGNPLKMGWLRLAVQWFWRAMQPWTSSWERTYIPPRHFFLGPCEAGQIQIF